MTALAAAEIPAALRYARILRRIVDRLAAVMAAVGGWNYVACALFITADVVGRAAFGVSSAATVEISGYMLACGISWSLAHTLAERAHIRVDVLVNRMPLRTRAVLHLVALLLLGIFSAFLAWAGWDLLLESLMFDAHDNSALHVSLAWPQGLWAFGLAMFLLMIAVLMLEALLDLVCGRYDEIADLLGARTIDDEADEALEAVAMARRETGA